MGQAVSINVSLQLVPTVGRCFKGHEMVVKWWWIFLDLNDSSALFNYHLSNI